MNLTIRRLRAIADALVQLDAKNRHLPERHYHDAETWVLQQINRRMRKKKQSDVEYHQ